MRQTDVYVSNCRVSLDFPNMLRLLFTKHDSLKLRQLRYNKIQLQCCHCALDGMWCNVMLWCDVVRNDVMWCDVTPRDRLNEMRERREISLKVSGCNDETKEAGGPSRCQPTHRSCPLLSPRMAEVPGLYCIVVWWELCSLLCLFAVMTSTGVTVRPGRPGEFLPCWSLLALSSLTR